MATLSPVLTCRASLTFPNEPVPSVEMISYSPMMVGGFDDGCLPGVGSGALWPVEGAICLPL